MKAEKPANGILKKNDWGDTKVYQIACSCSDPDHDHTIWVEADEFEVSVVIYTTNISTFWNKNRWKQIWEILTKGYIKQEVTISMNEQQALNYAETLKSAIEEVKIYKKEQKNGD